MILQDSPGLILATWLRNAGHGTDPLLDPPQPWPVYSGYMPSDDGGMDNALAVYNTPSRNDARLMATGERVEHYGVQIRIRAGQTDAAPADVTGWAKAEALARGLDTLLNAAVTVEANTYTLLTATRKGLPIPLGSEPGRSERLLWTINALLAIDN